MSNVTANAIDWYVNKLNEMHVIPANMATLFRDISAKQLGDVNFEPRPLTAKNFTDAELDAMHRLSYNPQTKKYDPITGQSYEGKKGKGYFGYGSRTEGAAEYLSPLRGVSTTLGMAGVSTDKKTGKTHIVDTYDFNVDETSYVKDPEGDGIIGADGNRYKNVEEYKKAIGNSGDEKTLYGRVRRNAGKFGHSSKDPDKNKIKASISIDDIKARLGDRLGTFDISKGDSKGKFVAKTALGGGMMAAPIGAGLGALSGAIQLLNNKKRKRWLRTMLSHIAVGSLISAAVGAAGGGYAAHRVYDALDGKSGDGLTKKSSVQRRQNEEDRKKKKRERLERLINILSYGAPLAVIGGLSIPIIRKARGVMNGITDAKSDVSSLIEARQDSDDQAWQYTVNYPSQPT